MESVDLTFETGPDGEAWDDPADTDFGYLNFTVFSPQDGRERSAVVHRVPTPDDPPASRYVVTNQNSFGEPGWLNVRFGERQTSPRVVFWLDPGDERIDESGSSNTLLLRGYDESGDRVFDRRTEITAGGYIVADVRPSDSTDRVSRIAITVRPPDGTGFSRFYVSRLGFDARPPDATLTVSQPPAESGDGIAVRADVETAGEITDYEWSVDGTRYVPSEDRAGDGEIRPPLGTGSHTVSVRVTDRLGLQGADSQTIFVQQADGGTGGVDLRLWMGVAGAGFVLLAALVVRRVRG